LPIFEEKRDEISIYICTNQIPLFVRKSLDLDLGEKFCVPLIILFFLSYSPIAFVALLEFDREGFDHLCGVLAIAFGA
jgi:hypothetical protein